MRILYLDLDSLRPDHLGCYGYHRDTSPNIDRIAAEGVRFEKCYASDVPCCPSRTALMSGQFGYHSGVDNHAGVAGDFRLEGPTRGFRSRLSRESLPAFLKERGYHTVSISPFAERHGAWWFLAGFAEMHNTGSCGMESAEEVTPTVMDWLERRGADDNWFMHLNYWDPHMPSRAPEEFGNPFEGEPVPEWLTDEVVTGQQGLNGIQQPRRKQQTYRRYAEGFRHGLGVEVPPRPRCPKQIETLDDVRAIIDGYDCGVRYMDEHLGRIFAKLEELGVMDDTAIIISADHGENLGELGVYGDHITADEITCHIPLIIKWPGGKKGALDSGLHYNLDLAPTLAELHGETPVSRWDGQSYAAAITDGSVPGNVAQASSLSSGAVTTHEYVVCSTGAGTCQRSVRFGDWLYIKSLHDGYNLFPDEMLFNLSDDPHEQVDLAGEEPDVLAQARTYLQEWETDMQSSMPDGYIEDPLQTIIREGGPGHIRSALPGYLKELEETGRGQIAEELRKKHTG